jgi:hypothetical protein
MKILLGYSYYQYSGFDSKEWVESWLKRLRSAGIHVYGFPLTLNPPGPCLTWNTLDVKWKRGDIQLLSMFEELASELENYDIFYNWNGINIHPEFVQQLPTLNIFGCADDPESSDILSKPVAWAYDLSLVNNIAEVDTYRHWGVNNVKYCPLGFFASEYDPTLTKDDILMKERKNDIVLICERKSQWRKERLDKFVKEFPKGDYYGIGWPNGFLPNDKKIPLYQNTKIGINIHNSTGPINFRTFELPSNGVLQICDNKSYLGKIFELNKEVVGFDTIEEAIELTHYYLEHEDERRKIAAAGWEKALKDYNEVTVFKSISNYVNELYPELKQKEKDPVAFLKNHRKRTAIVRTRDHLLNSCSIKVQSLKKMIKLKFDRSPS